MQLHGKVVLVTGAGSGIGQAVACRFAEAGADIAMHDVNEDGMASTAAQIRATERRVTARRVDVADRDAVVAGIEYATQELGPIDILVNVAGINIYKRVMDFTEEEWDRILRVNLNGVWYHCRGVLPTMIQRGSGAIVNVASIAVSQASYFRVPYVASKGGVGMLTRALALDLAEHGIRVNAVGPGITETGMTRPSDRRFGSVTPEMGRALTPLRRWVTPREQANAALFLASDEASGITGQYLFVDGGLTAGNQCGAEWRPEGDDLPWL